MTKTIRDRILLKRCRLDGGTQPRAEMNVEVIEDIAKSDSDNVPAIDAVFDGTWYWVWNGHHRTTGLRKGRHKEVWANIRRGTLRDAVFLSLQANADQKALRRMNADKARAIETMLDDPEWSEWPDNRIAEHCKVDRKTVGNHRRARKYLETRNVPNVEIPHSAPAVSGLPEEFMAVYEAFTDEQKAEFARKKDDELIRVQARTDTRGWLKGVEKDLKRLAARFQGKRDVKPSDRKRVGEWLEKVGATARKYEAASTA